MGWLFESRPGVTMPISYLDTTAAIPPAYYYHYAALKAQAVLVPRCQKLADRLAERAPYALPMDNRDAALCYTAFALASYVMAGEMDEYSNFVLVTDAMRIAAAWRCSHADCCRVSPAEETPGMQCSFRTFC